MLEKNPSKIRSEYAWKNTSKQGVSMLEKNISKTETGYTWKKLIKK